MPLPLSSEPQSSRVGALPTMHDLPSDDSLEPGLPDEFQFLAVGVPRLYGGKSSRSSYVIWDEKSPP
jgi:hypothetical protein